MKILLCAVLITLFGCSITGLKEKESIPLSKKRQKEQERILKVLNKFVIDLIREEDFYKYMKANTNIQAVNLSRSNHSKKEINREIAETLDFILNFIYDKIKNEIDLNKIKRYVQFSEDIKQLRKSFE